MNSLLQTLFMTPEFRSSLYNFRYVSRIHGAAKDCIPLQLQLLFGRLQLKEAAYQDTVALTKSFQWDSREAFEQCDVQEFCRVLFDAVELSVKQTPDLKNLITDLFSGHLRTSIDCHSCGFRSSTPDTFLDLSLSISSEELCSRSLYDALDAYFQPELLTGENQYLCQVCEQRTDAMRSQEMLRPPYVLFLHLKRFTIDPVTLGRWKINSEVQFPFLLNMSRYMSSETMSESNQNGLVGVQEHLYELYSVLVHSGSAMGGHYSAFIFSFSDHQWYHFNDTSVREVPQTDIAKTYGDSMNSNTQLYSGSSAYVLCYRKLDSKNITDVRDEEVPIHVREMLDSQEFDLKGQDLNPSSEAIMIKVQIHFGHQIETLEVSDDESLIRLLELAKITYGLETVADCDLRLRSIDPESLAPVETFHGREHLPLRYLNIGNFQALEIEIKSSDDRFEEFDQCGITLFIYLWTEDCWAFPDKPILEKCNSRRICISKNCLIADLLFLLSSESGIPVELLCVVTQQKEFLSSPNYHLASAAEVLKSNMNLYVELLDGMNAGSKWEVEIDRDRHRLKIHYFSHSLNIDSEMVIDSRISVERLKACIASDQNLNPLSFSLRFHGEEICDTDAPLHRLLTASLEPLFELAEMRKPNETMISFVLAELTSNGDGCYSFLPLCQVPVQEASTCSEVRKLILSKLQHPELSENQLLLRPRFGLRLSRPLQRFDTFKSSLKYDQRNFAVQVLPVPTADFDPDEVLILLRVLKGNKFTSISEFPILRHLTLEEFGEIVASRTGLNFASLQITKVAFSCNSADARNERWVAVASLSFQILSGNPWFLGQDGALFM